MKNKNLTLDEALEYCFNQINPKELPADDFNKLRQYKYRYEKGKLNRKGIQFLFDYFGVKETCSYSIS